MSDHEVWVDTPDDFTPHYEWEPLEVHQPGVEGRVRRQVADEIYAAIKKRRELAINNREPGWPLLTEAMVIAAEAGGLKVSDD